MNLRIMGQTKKKVVIIGGGLAGLSLATELVDENFDVVVLEKQQNLGGRASNTFDRKMYDPIPIGPHVIVTAYNNFQRFLQKIHAENAILWERKLFVEVVFQKQHYQSRITRIPRPFHVAPWILDYPFIGLRDKLSHFRLAFKIVFSARSDFEKLDGQNTYDFLAKLGVTENAINKFWRFFVLTQLNVPIELCSAAEFCLLLKQWSQLKHRKVGFAKVGLGDVYTEAAEQYIKQRGGFVRRNALMTKIAFEKNRISHLMVRENGAAEKLEADIYVSTLHPIDLREMLPEDIRFSDFFRGLNAFEPAPYITTGLWFDKKISNKKFWIMVNDSKTPRYINSDFYDQSNIYATRKNNSFVTSNIIYSKPYDSLPDAEIVKKTLEEIKEAFPRFDGKPIHYHVHRVPYVIYAPFPGMRQYKLPHKTPIENFYLSGDWTVKEVTQCMESAVRSGYKCAEEILRSSDIRKKICDDRLT